MGNNIPVPYSGHLPGQIQIGDSVTVGGRPFPNCKSFLISLGAGPTLDNDVAFVFNPRFDEGCVVRNSQHNRAWGAEERKGHIPFSRGLDFQVQIQAKPNVFEVLVNGAKFCTFKYRMPKEMVSYLHISGDLTITYIQNVKAMAGAVGAPVFGGALAGSNTNIGFGAFQPPTSYPSPYPPPYTPPMGPIDRPRVPLNMPIQGGMCTNRIVNLIGRVNPNATRFSVYFMCGPSTDFDIPFVFDVRLRFSGDHNVIVKNSKQNGQWGHEERGVPYFPFMPGTNFEIMILVDDCGYKVAVNNQHYTQFNHRIHPLTMAGHLSITGDITLNQIRFQ